MPSRESCCPGRPHRPAVTCSIRISVRSFPEVTVHLVRRSQMRSRARTTGSIWLLSLLGDLIEATPLQILRSHCRKELDRRIKLQEPWLCEPWYLGCIRHVDDKEATSLAIFRAEIGGLGFRFIENASQLLAGCSITNRLIEFFHR